ncbi:MAG: hypothetical protein JNK90_24780 [Planctomycetaceae bacterium]|nr:hypothetical protein [Planctomycetaceae bacterium]
MANDLFIHFEVFLSGSLGLFLVAFVGLFLAVRSIRHNPRVFIMLSIGCGIFMLATISTPVLFFLLNLALRESNASPAVTHHAANVLRIGVMLSESLGFGLVVASAMIGGKKTP